jgi:glyoxylase-like metal-dependent hydrolase (beta-lactamase superfamily II)
MFWSDMMTTGGIRRREMLALLAGAAAAPFATCARADLMIGAKKLTTISDGNLVLPVSFVFPEAPAETLRTVLIESGQGTGMLEPECNVSLLRHDDRLILFDVGSGANFQPTAGRLLENLEAAGVAPEAITDVIFTHGHPDHLWGLQDDFDEYVYANANYHINRTEWDYWRASDTLEKTPDERKSFVVGAQNRFSLLEDRINLFGYGDEVVAGVEAVDTSGHTQGHTSFAIHDAGQSAMILGDALTNFAVSFEYPDWVSGTDHEPQKAVTTRKKLLDRLAGDKMTIAGFHLSAGGIGRVERKAAAYRFASLD